MDKHTDYSSAIAFLESLPAKSEWTLKPVGDLCGLLGFDPKKVPCMLIGGTNGKGSVAAFCESAIRKAGYMTGRCISPHLVDYTERISINGSDVSKEEFGRIISEAGPVVLEYNRNHGEKLSQFEVTTAAALKYFLDSNVDFAIIEVGMGGRLDSTNVAEPALSVITTVSLDHTRALGDTIKKIAVEKAGIMHPGKPVVTGCGGAALSVIKKIAKERECEAVIVAKEGGVGSDFAFSKENISLSGTEVEISSKLGTTKMSTNLLGSFQCFNMAIAYSALSRLDALGTLKISQEEIRRGFLCTSWPGRFEVVSEKPLLVFDGAHNPDGAMALAESVRILFPDKKIFIVCGMMEDKDVESSVASIAPLAAEFFATPVASHRTATAKRVADAARKYCPKVEQFEDAAAALAHATEKASAVADGMVLVAGSLYLVGQLKETLASRSLDREKSN